MKITRGYSRKINLGNFETADFWAEYEDEHSDSKQLYELAKADVTLSITEFDSARLLTSRKVVYDTLVAKFRSLKNSPLKAGDNQRDLAMLKFQIDLVKDDIKSLGGDTKKHEPSNIEGETV